MAIALRESMVVLPRRAARKVVSTFARRQKTTPKGLGFFVWWQTMLEDYANLVMPKFVD